MNKRIVFITFLGMCIALLGMGSPAQAEIDVGQPAPVLVTPELSGQSFDLSAHKDSVVIVHFWATWCVPCKEEMPVLDSFYQQYHTRGVEIIAVSVDRPHNRDKVNEYMKAFHFPASIAEDASSNGFGSISSLPVTYVIDKNSMVRAKLTPDKTPLNEKSLSDIILPLVGK